MATEGYSGTPLIEKLAIMEGVRLRLIDPPDNYFSLLQETLSAKLFCLPVWWMCKFVR